MSFVKGFERSAAACLLLALAACGGDGGLGVNSTPAVSGSGTSTATPAPVTPSGLSASTSFGATMASGSFVSIPSSAGTYVSYDASSNTYALVSSLPTITFNPSSGDPTEVSFGRGISGSANYGGGVYVVTHTGNDGFAYTYTAIASAHLVTSSSVPVGTGVSDTFAVFGMPTAAAAVPRTGSATYALDLLGTYLGSGTGNVNFGSGTYSFSGNVTQSTSFDGGGGINRQAATGTFQSTGTLASASNGFSGTVNLAVGANSYSGPLGGMFFGTAAQELGGTFVAASTTSGATGTAAAPVVGAILGHR